MAEHTDLNSLSTEVIDEYLAAAKLLMSRTKSDDGIYGYSAALLMMSVIDSLGHAQNGASSGADFSLLEQQEFGLPTGASKRKLAIKQLNDWYRNGLVHTGTMAPNVYLLAETTGPAFCFDAEDKLHKIRLPVLFSIVERQWAVRKDKHEAPRMHPEAEARTPQANSLSGRLFDLAISPLSESGATVSGMTSIRGSARSDAKSSESE